PSAMVPLLITFGLIGLVGIGVLAWWWFSSSGLGTEMNYLPDDMGAIVSFRVEQFLGSGIYADLKKDVKELEKLPEDETFKREFGVLPNKVERLTMAMSPKAQIAMVRLNTAVPAADIKSAFKGEYKETTVGKFTMHEPKEGSFGPAFCLAENKLLLVAPAEALKKVLERNKKPD